MATTSLEPIMVFPTTKLSPVNKLITEGNLTRIINNILDTDTYIIPPKTISDDIVWNVGAGTSLVKLLNDEQGPIDIMLHGYYFSLNLNSILAAFPQGVNKKLVVSIIIDKTVTDYPELYGEIGQQTSTDPIGTNVYPFIYDASGNPLGPVPENPTVINEAYRKLDITDVYAEDSSVPAKTFHFTITPEWNLELYTTEATAPVFEQGYQIKYVSLYNLLQYSVLDIDATEIPDTFELSTLPTARDIYSMDIMYQIDGQYYLPMNNFPKFVSQSIVDIDGGEI